MKQFFRALFFSATLISSNSFAYNYVGVECDWDYPSAISGDKVVLKEGELKVHLAAYPDQYITYFTKVEVVGSKDASLVGDAVCPRTFTKSGGFLTMTYSCLLGKVGTQTLWADGVLRIDSITGQGNFSGNIDLSSHSGETSGTAMKNCKLFRDDGLTEQFGRILP